MKHLILKTVNAEGRAFRGFQWPTEGPVEAPDWDPKPKCGSGLHGLLDGRGDVSLLDWWWSSTQWVLFEANEVVDLDGKVKTPKGTVVYYGDMGGALQILADKAGLSSVREWICQDPEWAYFYALNVDEKPQEDTRSAACQDPHWAYYYALYIDRKPRDDTRSAACKNPYWAYRYAVLVDQKPRDDTREATREDPEWFCMYLLDVDQAPQEGTKEASKWAAKCREWEEEPT